MSAAMASYEGRRYNGASHGGCKGFTVATQPVGMVSWHASVEQVCQYHNNRLVRIAAGIQWQNVIVVSQVVRRGFDYRRVRQSVRVTSARSTNAVPYVPSAIRASMSTLKVPQFFRGLL